MLEAYRHGLFPMPIGRDEDEVLAWWSPDPRGVLPFERLRVTRSLRASCKRYRVRFDTDFEGVIDACAEPGRTGRWITRDVRDAYVALHRLGWAHSVEVLTLDGALAGGLYGLAIGGLFAGESMFHRGRDASKVALVALVDALRGDPRGLLDVQWLTPHLASLGAIEVPRAAYLERLAIAVSRPLPAIFEETSR